MSSGFTEITAAQLMRLLGTPAAPVILDVRLPEDAASAPVLVPTARRAAHDDLPADALGGRHVVCVCAHGHRVSHGAAAVLRAAGARAEALAGGMTAWRAGGYPAIPAAALPGPLWVTRHRPKVDRVACPWLIRRFVDPGARILFVPPAEVEGVAGRFGATPFDAGIPPFADAGGRCTFDAMIARFELAHPALDRLADVVRAADSGQSADVPEAAGLLALSVGLSRAHRSDDAQIEAAMPLYDALYRWARDGAGETHGPHA